MTVKCHHRKLLEIIPITMDLKNSSKDPGYINKKTLSNTKANSFKYESKIKLNIIIKLLVETKEKESRYITPVAYKGQG